MESETKSIYARIHKHALIRGGVVPKIGEVVPYNNIQGNGEIAQVKLITFDWYEDGNKDVFVFNGQCLVGNAIHPHTPTELVDEYIKIIAKSPSEPDFIDEIVSYFVFSEMGFYRVLKYVNAF
jgi:hypothetical protein